MHQQLTVRGKGCTENTSHLNLSDDGRLASEFVSMRVTNGNGLLVLPLSLSLASHLRLMFFVWADWGLD
jgi:hypothetical protein